MEKMERVHASLSSQSDYSFHPLCGINTAAGGSPVINVCRVLLGCIGSAASNNSKNSFGAASLLPRSVHQ
jgi:hypothetical protein